MNATGGSENLVIAGIPTRGATLARRLVNRIREVSGTYADLAVIDTTMFRDDLASQPLRAPKETLIPVTGIDGKTVVLVDDVLYTGRTIKAALDALTRIGRPAAVSSPSSLTAATVSCRSDRLRRQEPADSRDETVTILLDETDGRDGVLLGKGL